MNIKNIFELRVNISEGKQYRLAIKFTEEGWEVVHSLINGRCLRNGAPILYQNLSQEKLSYPESIKSDVEQLWEKYSNNRITAEEVQVILDRLGKWVAQTTEARPELWD